MGFQTERVRLNELINSLETFLLGKFGNKKLICYGASSLWTDINRIVAIDDLVEFFVDGDNSRWGDEYFGLEIRSPEVLSDMDKSEYSVVVLAGAVEEISGILEKMGWEKNVNYFDIYQYIHIYREMSYGPINKFLRFLKTVPSEMKNVPVREDSERIGIVLNAEGLNFGTTYMPYEISLFLILKWRGYNVKLIVDRLHWDGDIELYEGHCAVCDYLRDVVIGKLENLVAEDDILYIDPVGDTELSLEDEKECERIAAYSVRWSKWYNDWNSRFRSGKLLQDEFAGIFKRNLSYINTFFEKNHFDTINAMTALHKIAGVYYYAGRKRNIRASSQDGMQGSTLICANGPASYGEDIPKFFEKQWGEIANKDAIMDRAEQMWKTRRGGASRISDMSFSEYIKLRREKGYENISFQSPETELEQTYDVIIPMNLVNDGAALGIDTVFNDMEQWLQQTLDFVIHKLNATVLIREHPSMMLLPSYMAKSELCTVYPEILKQYEGNKLLRYVKSEEQINLYQYIEHCKVLIPWASTVGMEAGIMGKNVLVHTNVYYENAIFACRAYTREEYFEKLEKCITCGEFLAGNKQQAYEEALRYFYYTMNRRLKTDFTIVSSFDSPWKFNSFGELIKAEGIDEVVQIVAENVPSVYLIEEQRKRLGEL